MAAPSDAELQALTETVARKLTAAGALLATAESCTGGWIAKACTDLPGSSRWFLGGAVAYADAAKTSLLGVPGSVLAANGAVSEPVVRAMAQGALERFEADYSIAVSGVAGPDGRDPRKARGHRLVRLGAAVAGGQCDRLHALRATAGGPGLRAALDRPASAGRPARAMTDRLFFALWPDEPLRPALAGRLPHPGDGLDGKPQRPDQWHVTLEFLGDVPTDRQAALHRAAGQVRAQPFTVYFDELEHWRKPQVYCLAASQAPAPLAALVRGLRAALAEEGFTPEAARVPAARDAGAEGEGGPRRHARSAARMARRPLRPRALGDRSGRLTL